VRGFGCGFVALRFKVLFLVYLRKSAANGLARLRLFTQNG